MALYERVRRFTVSQLWEPKGGLSPETRLAADIGIAGLDGKAFMEAYAQEFGVDLTGFDWMDSFGPEDWVVWSSFLLRNGWAFTIRAIGPDGAGMPQTLRFA